MLLAALGNSEEMRESEGIYCMSFQSIRTLFFSYWLLREIVRGKREIES